MARFFTSDTHFFHSNIIKYCNRPFKSAEEMNKVLIANWNSVVKPEDTVYHLGDVMMCGMIQGQYIMSQLNGYKILIQGNHDKNLPQMKRLGFDEVHTHLQIDFNDEKVWLSHYPYAGTRETYPSVDYKGKTLHEDGNLLLCGHVHTFWKTKGRMINVGVDVWDYTPVSELQLLGLYDMIKKEGVSNEPR